MQTQAKTKGLFLAAGIVIGMLVAFGIVWLDLERLKDQALQEIAKILPKSKTEKPKTDTLVIVEKQLPGTNNNTGSFIPDTASAAIDTLPPLPTDSLGLLVKKDELLYTKNIKVIRLTASGQTAIDTAMAQAANIEPATIPASYLVEFWKSPINYRGYKLGRNKLVLFGIYRADDISLVSLGSALYLKNHDYYFKLEPSEDFLTLNAVTDKNLLALLNQ